MKIIIIKGKSKLGQLIKSSTLHMLKLIKTNDNISYYCFSKKDYISYCLKEFGEFEPEIKSVSKYLLNNKSGNVIDIGANIGTYCLPLAKTFPNLRFKTFEIQKKVHQILNKNIKINNIKNIDTYNFGLSDKKSKLCLNIPEYIIEKNIGSFSIDKLTRSNNYEVGNSSVKEVFTLKKLDNFDFKKIALIKLDVEGHELEVLRGAKKTIIRNKYPFIIFETWESKFYKRKKNKTLNFLKNLGYKIITMNMERIAYFRDNLNVEFVKSYAKIVEERNRFNPSNQGFRYHCKNIPSTLRKSIMRLLRNF